MRMIGGFATGGAILGAVIGVLVHLSTYTVREGVYIVGDERELLVRPPWPMVVLWIVVGLVIGALVGVVLRVLGFRLVRNRG